MADPDVKTPEDAVTKSHVPRSSAPRAAERIRDTARDLFYRDGIRAVGVDEIVEKAGCTKPSLYRAYASKDDLVADVLRQSEADFWGRFDEAVAAHPGDPRAQLAAFFARLADRSVREDYRGCALTNAAVEYPDRAHPARPVLENHKAELRARLRATAAAMGAADPDALGDGLLLLIEGAYVSSQMFPKDGPSGVVAKAADALIRSYLA
jgi:AcrR family transcriptional regulator